VSSSLRWANPERVARHAKHAKGLNDALLEAEFVARILNFSVRVYVCIAIFFSDMT